MFYGPIVVDKSDLCTSNLKTKTAKQGAPGVFMFYVSEAMKLLTLLLLHLLKYLLNIFSTGLTETKKVLRRGAQGNYNILTCTVN